MVQTVEEHIDVCIDHVAMDLDLALAMSSVRSDDICFVIAPTLGTGTAVGNPSSCSTR